MMTNRVRKKILKRIERLERELIIAHEYLSTGKHAHWHKFKPLFKEKMVAGKASAPHKDWVRNVFIPNCERALSDAEKLLERSVK